MFKNYVKITLRNFFRHKGYSFLNVFGLGIGMAACLLILLLVKDELSFDRFHENRRSIARVITIQNGEGVQRASALTAAPLAARLKQDFAEIVEAVCFNNGSGGLIKAGDKFFSPPSFQFTDSGFFRMFSFEFIHGDPETALDDPHSVVLTDEIALRFFGRTDVLEEVIQVANRISLQVTGIIRKPRNSHIPLNIVVSNQLYKTVGVDITSWNRYNYTTYIQLHKDASFEEVGKKIEGYLSRAVNPQMTATLKLQPLSRIYLHSDYAYDVHTQTSSVAVVYLLSLIAVAILFVACINFMNLATARSERRMKEVGLRKVIGAQRKQLIFQFLNESVMMAVCGLVLAVGLVEFVLPAFNHLVMRDLKFLGAVSPGLLIGLAGIALLTGLGAGIYPAFFLSSFSPANTVKGAWKKGAKGSGIRKFLVVGQFTFSILLISATTVVHKQIRYMQTKDLGYDKEQIVCLRINSQVRSMYQAMKRDLLQNPRIKGVTACMNLPNWEWPSVTLSDWEGRTGDRSIMLCHASVDYDFFATMGMEIVTGRAFSPEYPADARSSLIINQEAARQMGLDNPLGKHLSTWGHEGQIVGVVKDFHFDTLRNRIRPLVLKYAPAETSYMIIRLNPGDLLQAVKSLEQMWKKFIKSYPFRYRFLDDVLNQNYIGERIIQKIVTVITLLAVFVACMGLFGLASYMAEKRTKEIGIRKVMGASVSGLVVMLSREFTRWVLIAAFLAVPMGFFLMRALIQNYSYRITLSLGLFLWPAFLALLVAVMTVSYQSVRAANVDPIKSLRYE